MSFGRRIITQRHFTKVGNNNWIFFSKPLSDDEKFDKITLFQIGDVRLKRHILCTGGNPYDPDNWDYYAKRVTRLYLNDPDPKSRRSRLYKRQNGLCPVCETPLDLNEEWEIHHIIPRSKKGSEKLSNLSLLHKTCHRQITYTKNNKLKALFNSAGLDRSAD